MVRMATKDRRPRAIGCLSPQLTTLIGLQTRMFCAHRALGCKWLHKSDVSIGVPGRRGRSTRATSSTLRLCAVVDRAFARVCGEALVPSARRYVSAIICAEPRRKANRTHRRARREDGVWVIEASGTEPGPHCVDDVDGRQPYNHVEVNQRIAWQRGFTLRHGTDELKVVRVCNAGDEDIDLAPREDALDKRSINRLCSPPDMQLFTPSC